MTDEAPAAVSHADGDLRMVELEAERAQLHAELESVKRLNERVVDQNNIAREVARLHIVWTRDGAAMNQAELINFSSIFSTTLDRLVEALGQ